jgi:tripartite-type tricarboxylate transporter receptor subunit TctC
LKGLILLALLTNYPFNSLTSNLLFAQEPFYKGKTIRIVVGFAPGGGYDLYSRTIARHLGKYIPGNPTVIVENMDGAGSRIAANTLYKATKPDGLTIANFIGGLFVQQLLGDPGVEFDAKKFEYIGVPTQDNYMMGISKRVGIKSAEEWMASKKMVKFGGVARGSATDDIPRILAATIGLPVQVVSGYKGTGPLRIAFDSGEVDGVCNAWESFRATWRSQLDSGDVIIVLQNTAKRHSELANVPLAIDFAKTEEAQKLVRALIHPTGPTARPYVLPPGTPNDRVQTLRKAYMDTMKDSEFLAEAKKAKLDITPLDGATLERNVKEVFTLDPALIAKAKEILK